jgi:hypothetical protein
MNDSRSPRRGLRWYQFSLSTLLWLTVLVAISVAWWVDHALLSRANANLNVEAADLFTKWTMSHSETLSSRSGGLPPARSYDFTKPEDRAAYAENHKTWSY